MHELIERILHNMKHVIVGKERTMKYMITCLLSEGHVLLEGVPGVGKTRLAISLAQSLKGDFKRLQFTPDILPSDVTGFYLYNKKDQEFEYREGAAVCNFLLADEINRASPRVQSSLLEVMEERQITLEGTTMELPDPFMVIATENDLESQGTYPLPEAQLDRFFMKLHVNYPSREEWERILHEFEILDSGKSLKGVATLDEIKAVKREVTKTVVSTKIIQYVLDITEAIREHEMVQLGISPRGTIALIKGAKGWAFIQGRDYVTPDDIQDVAIPILGHRIMLEASADWNSVKVEELIKEILSQVKVPVF